MATSHLLTPIFKFCWCMHACTAMKWAIFAKNYSDDCKQWPHPTFCPPYSDGSLNSSHWNAPVGCPTTLYYTCNCTLNYFILAPASIVVHHIIISLHTNYNMYLHPPNLCDVTSEPWCCGGGGQSTSQSWKIPLPYTHNMSVLHTTHQQTSQMGLWRYVDGVDEFHSSRASRWYAIHGGWGGCWW